MATNKTTHCLFRDCARFVHALGLCLPHYKRHLLGEDLGVQLAARKRQPNGTKRIDQQGYVRIWKFGQVMEEHRAIAANVLGRKLHHPEQVHHVNEDRSDNRHSNLVICPDYAYHALLHKRRDALLACGNANWVRCVYCGQHDDPEKMHFGVSRNQHYHLSCCSEYNRKARIRRHQESMSKEDPCAIAI